MKSSKLPPSVLVGAATEPVRLAELLGWAADDPEVRFLHLDRLLGEPFSGRMLSKSKLVGLTLTVPLPHPMGVVETAAEFFDGKFMAEARYDPPTQPPWRGLVKGWEVRQFWFEGESVVIVWARWV